MTEKTVPALEIAARIEEKVQRERERVRVMRVSIAVCRLPARLRRRGKPMNFVYDGVHRMFQLTQRSPPELRSNSRRMQSILQARTWDAQSIFVVGVSSRDYALRPTELQSNSRRMQSILPETPRTGGKRFACKSVGHEMVVPRTDAVVLASRPEQGNPPPVA